MTDWIAAIAASIAVLVALGQGWYARSQAKNTSRQALEAQKNSELLAEASRMAKDEAERQATAANEARLATEKIAATLDGHLQAMEKLATAAQGQERMLAKQLLQYQDSLKRADADNIYREKVELLNMANDLFITYGTISMDTMRRRPIVAAAFTAQFFRTLAVLRTDSENALLDDEFCAWLQKYEKAMAEVRQGRKSNRETAERSAKLFESKIRARLLRLLDEPSLGPADTAKPSSAASALPEGGAEN